MPEVSLCAGEQRWSQMVSVVQSVWSLNKYRALLPDLMPPWGEVVGRGCACSAGFLSWPVSWHWCAWGLLEGEKERNWWWWGPNSVCSSGLQQCGHGCPRGCRSRALGQALVASGVLGSPLAAAGIGFRLCPTSLWWHPQWPSSFAQSLHCYNYIFSFFPFSRRKRSR